jgi:methyltransferase (TIGR00027 family)
MQPGRPSRTAEYMALFRALEHARPPARRLFTDPFARAFLGPRLRWLVTLSVLPGFTDMVYRAIDRRWPGARTSAVARTRLIDDRVATAIAEGVRQIVLLGGGFDSRPYRLAGLERLACFEVDHPSTQARKRQVVGDVIGAAASQVRFAPTDFFRDSIELTLPAAGFEESRPTLFIWEGVTNYLTDSAVDHTLRWYARAAPPSQIVFTYVDRAVLDDPAAFHGTRRLLSTLEASGERWTFGLDPIGLEGFLRERGYRLDEDLGAAEYRARYFGSASTAMRGYEFYRVAAAHVAGPRGRHVPGTSPLT